MEQTDDGRVPLGLETMEDDSGHRLTEVVADALGEAEAWLQKRLTEGVAPEKPVKITVSIEVLAQGRFTRGISWGVGTKLPQIGKRYGQLARTQAGVLVTEARRQPRLPHTIPATNVADLEGDDG